MKKSVKSITMISLMAVSLLVVSSCQKDELIDDNSQYASVLSVSSDGTSSIIDANLKLALIETSDINDSEIASLLKMKEEEKLARDVYSVLYQKWESIIFSNISTAENNHLNAIVLLLASYGTADTSIAEPGIFANAEVQTLYNELVAKASVSIEEAYKTGALIEEMDINDLSVALNTTTNENVILVFENLLKGSRNHLRVFNRQLSALGLVYSPVFISQTDYDLIVNSSMENGKQYRMNGQSKGNGQGQGQGKGRKGQGSNNNGTCNN